MLSLSGPQFQSEILIFDDNQQCCIPIAKNLNRQTLLESADRNPRILPAPLEKDALKGVI
jgi:hypothetical protein